MFKACAGSCVSCYFAWRMAYLTEFVCRGFRPSLRLMGSVMPSAVSGYLIYRGLSSCAWGRVDLSGLDAQVVWWRGGIVY